MKGWIRAGCKWLRENSGRKFLNETFYPLTFFLRKKRSGIIWFFAEEYFRTSGKTAVFAILDYSTTLEVWIERGEGQWTTFPSRNSVISSWISLCCVFCSYFSCLELLSEPLGWMNQGSYWSWLSLASLRLWNSDWQKSTSHYSFHDPQEIPSSYLEARHVEESGITYILLPDPSPLKHLLLVALQVPSFCLACPLCCSI